MVSIFLILFFTFLGSTIAVFIRPKQFLKEKTEKEAKQVKIGLTVITIIFFVLFGVSSDASKQNKAPQPSATPQTNTIQEKTVSYEVIKSWVIPNGGYGKVIVISPQNFNENDMALLGEKLKVDLKNDRNSFIFIFDDRKAAEMRDKSSSTDLNNIPIADQDYYFKHYIGEYSKNGNNDYHELTIYFDGLMGTNQKTIKY